jgi:hypothetical protein
VLRPPTSACPAARQRCPALMVDPLLGVTKARHTRFHRQGRSCQHIDRRGLTQFVKLNPPTRSLISAQHDTVRPKSASRRRQHRGAGPTYSRSVTVWEAPRDESHVAYHTGPDGQPVEIAGSRTISRACRDGEIHRDMIYLDHTSRQNHWRMPRHKRERPPQVLNPAPPYTRETT